ncbi:hypothetical protein LCL95_13850 [Bacillus timonensis]|nr:hypothetical protein [Bacillus timonensis]
MEKNMRVASISDIEVLKEFLGQAGVSNEGLEAIVDHFVLIENDKGQLMGTVGLERIEQDGLLRSLVISPAVDQTMLLALFKSVLELAKQKEMKRVFLATNKKASVDFFALLGFNAVEREEIPMHIEESKHVSKLLQMDQSLFMELKLS